MGGDGATRFLRAHNAENTSDYLVLADTRTDNPLYAPAGMPSSQFHIWNKTGIIGQGHRWVFQVSGIHLRHPGSTANGWFLDSHVESCNLENLLDIDVKPAYDEEGSIDPSSL